MQLLIQVIERARVIAITGRFDVHIVPAVEQALAPVSAPAGDRLVLDLAAVNFIDSTALSLLVATLKRCRAVGGDLRLCGLQKPVQVIFRLTRMDAAFAIFDTAPQALAGWE